MPGEFKVPGELSGWQPSEAFLDHSGSSNWDLRPKYLYRSGPKLPQVISTLRTLRRLCGLKDTLLSEWTIKPLLRACLHLKCYSYTAAPLQLRCYRTAV